MMKSKELKISRFVPLMFNLSLILTLFNQVLGHGVLTVDVLSGSVIYTCAGRALGNVLLKVQLLTAIHTVK